MKKTANFSLLFVFIIAMFGACSGCKTGGGFTVNYYSVRAWLYFPTNASYFPTEVEMLVRTNVIADYGDGSPRVMPMVFDFDHYAESGVVRFKTAAETYLAPGIIGLNVRFRDPNGIVRYAAVTLGGGAPMRTVVEVSNYGGVVETIELSEREGDNYPHLNLEPSRLDSLIFGPQGHFSFMIAGSAVTIG